MRFRAEGGGFAGLWLWLAVCAVPLYFLPGRLTVEADKARLIELLAVPAFVAIVVRWYLGANRSVNDAVWIGGIALAFTWFMSCMTAIGPRTAIVGGPFRGHGLLFFAACLTWMAFAAGIAHSCHEEGRERVLWGIALSWTGPGLLGAVQAFWPGLILGDPEGRVGSTFGNPSFLRDYLAVCIALQLALMLPRRWTWALVGIGLLAFGAWTIHSRPKSVAYRLDMWEAMKPMVREVPAWGWGPDSGQLVVDFYAHGRVDSDDSRAQDRTENFLLDAIVERGGPGAVAELIFWGAVLWTGRRSKAAPALAVGLALALISVCSVPSWFLLYVLAGIAISERRSDSHMRRTVVHPKPNIVPIRAYDRRF